MGTENDALLGALRQAVEQSGTRPKWSKRAMPAIAASLTVARRVHCGNCGDAISVYNPLCCHVEGCHECVAPSAADPDRG